MDQPSSLTQPSPTDQAPPPSRLLIIGANGGIGRQCVEAALAAGHHVTALLRNPANLPLTHPHLQIVKGDILDPATFSTCLEKTQAVISAIGVKGTKPTTLYSRGNAIILQEMKKAGIKRAFFISASAVEISPVLPFYVKLAAKYIVQKILRHMYADLRKMEAEIKESDANWTIIRPPRLTDQPATGHYRFSINSFLPNCLKISRADVAHFIIANITNKATYKSTIEIAY
jgi:putative NADH-flavin reductase